MTTPDIAMSPPRNACTFLQDQTRDLLALGITGKALERLVAEVAHPEFLLHAQGCQPCADIIRIANITKGF